MAFSKRNCVLLAGAALVAFGLWDLLRGGQGDGTQGLSGPATTVTALGAGDVSSGRELETSPRSQAPVAASQPSVEPQAEAVFEPVDWYGDDPWQRAPWGSSLEIQGRVIRGRQAMPGVRVQATRGRWDTFTAPATWEAEALTDGEGRFSFGEVVPGEWQVGAEVDGAQLRVRVKVVAKQSRTRGVLLAFGASSILARVFDDGGNRLVGVPVYCSGIGPGPSRLVQAVSDSRGEARLAGLVAGRYHVRADRSAHLSQTPEYMVLLPNAGERVVDIGQSSVPVLWSGQLVDGSGAEVALGETLRLVHAETRMEQWLRLKGSEFELSLSAGTWDVHTRGRGFDLGQLVDSVKVGSAHLNQDLVFPRTRVILEVVGAQADHLTDALMVARTGTWSNRYDGSPEIISGQTLEFLGVPAGRYTIHLPSPWRFSEGVPGAQGSQLAIEVFEGEPVLRVPLEVER